MSRTLFVMAHWAGAVVMLATGAAGGPVQVAEPPGAVVLENEFIQVTIEPALGGAVTRFVHKRTGKNLAGNYVGERPSQGFGLVIDRFWPKSGGQVRSLESLPYRAQVVRPEKAGDEARVILKKLVKDQRAKDLLIEKQVCLRPGVARLDVHYSISNMGQGVQMNRLWITNVLRPSGTKSERLVYFSPAPEGVVEHRHDPARPAGENVWVVPQRDWRAVIGESGAGAVGLADSRYLEKMYSFLPSAKSGGDYCTFEWLFQSVQLKPLNPPEGDINRGHPFRTSVSFIPFTGLRAVHGASADFVGEIEPDAKRGEVVVRVAAARAAQASVDLEYRTLPSHAPRKFPRVAVALKPDSTGEARFKTGPLGEGSHVFTCRVSARDCDTAVLERLVVIGKASGKYRLARLQPKAPTAVPEVKTTLPTTFESEHVKWAKPWAGGKLRALFVVPYRSSREVVEVAQRLSLDFEAILTWHCYTLEALQTKPLVLHTKMLELLKKDWDVIVFGATYWRMWPPEAQKAIARKIASGTGVVYVWGPGGSFLNSIKGYRWTREDEAFVREAVPTRVIPPWQEIDPAKLIKLAEYEKGRIAFLDYPVAPDPRKLRFKSAGGFTPRNPVSDAGYPFWEYHHSLLAKALLWAGRKAPDVRITRLEVGPSTVVASARAPVELRVAVRNASAREGKLALRVWTHDDLGVVTDVPGPALGALRAKEFEVTMPLPVPRAAGRHFVTLWVEEDGKKLDWRTVSYEVASHVRFGKVTGTASVLKVGQPVRATVEISADRATRGELTAEVVDATGRLLADQRQPLALQGGENKSVAVAVTPRNCLMGRHRLVLTLRENGCRLARARVPFAVDCRGYDDYVSIIWGGARGDYTGRVQAQALARTGCFDAVVTSAGRPGGYDASEAGADHAAAEGLGIYAINLHHFHCNDPGVVRKPCFSDPKALDVLREELRAKTAWLVRFAPLAYLMGDEMSLGPENAFTDFCQSPTCLAGFRRHLKDTYGTIERLNASWRTALRTFDEAKPFTFSQAQKAGKYAPWADHRAFMDKVFAGAFAFARGVFSERDPRPLVGYSGGGSWNIAVNGYNRWELYQVCKGVTDYGPDSPDIMRCFMKGDHVSSWWWGMYGGGPENVRRSTPWTLIFRGLNGSGFFAAYGCGRTVFGDYGLLNPGYVAKPNVLADLREDVKPLREGIGKLLLSSTRVNHGIAIHYSHPSVRAAYVLGEAPVTERLWNKARWGFETALRDAGLQFDLVAPKQIESGALSRFRVLLMPLSQSLTRAEASAIRKFVQAGGVVVADALAGRFDEHLARQDPPLLADVLGLNTGPPAVTRDSIAFDDNSPLKGLARVASPPVCADVRLSTATAWAHGARTKVPAVCVNRLGKGAAYTLNFTMNACLDGRGAGKGGESRALVARVLALHGVSPQVHVLKKGQPVRGLEITQFISGGAQFVGLLQDHRAAARPGLEVAIEFPRRAHVYDVRARKYLGNVRVLRTELKPARARLFALIPERISAVRVVVPRRVRPGEAFEVKAEYGARTRYGRVLRLDVLGPDGKPRTLYGQNLFSLDGRFATRVPLALNDPEGQWTVLVRDVATGVNATASVEVVR